MMPDPTVVFMVARAEHALRVRKAQRAWEDEAAVREGRTRSTRAPLRRRAGDVLVSLGRRLQGTTPSPTAGELGRVAG